MRSMVRDELEGARDELQHLVLRVLLQMPRERAHVRCRQVGDTRGLAVHPCAGHWSVVTPQTQTHMSGGGDAAQLTA